MIYLAALLSAAFYGAADFVGGLASRRAATLTVVTVSQSAGLALLLLAMPFLGAATPRTSDFGWGAAAGLAGGTGVALLYRALAIGTMGVVAPTTAVCAVAIPVLASVLRGERPPPLVVAGILIAMVAIVLVGQEPHPDASGLVARAARPGLPKGVPHALASGVAIGFFFLLLARTRPEAGMWPLVAARLAVVPCFALFVVATGGSLGLARPTAVMAVGGGALDMLANVLYLLATRYGELPVAVTLSSLYPASTVALARVVLGERLSLLQRIGIACALLAVVLIVAGGRAAP